MKHSWTDPDAGVSGAYEFPVGDELRGERATLGKSLLDVQRDLRIKAAFIAAIEDADVSVFANRGVIPGYVRSYARYLDRDPEEIYRRFCAETGFTSASFGGARQPAGRAAGVAKSTAPARGGFPDFPLAPRKQGIGLSAVPLSAIGSLLVMAGLVAGLGYGSWAVLRNIQRVQFAPVEELPIAVAELSDMAAPSDPALSEPALTDLASPVTATALTDLYRNQEAEVPILVPRDGPIASINPDRIGPLASYSPPSTADAVLAPVSLSADAASQAIAASVAASMGLPASTGADPAVSPARPATAPMIAAADAPVGPLLSAAATAPVAANAKLTVVAERAAWVRVYLANGTIIFERILEKGESYTPPDGVGAPLIWAGNSGSVYVRVDGTLRGPLGSGTRAARDVSLEPAAVVATYPVVQQVPEVLSQSLGNETGLPVTPAVAIQ